MKQSTIDGINAALDHAREKYGAKWIGALPLKQRGMRHGMAIQPDPGRGPLFIETTRRTDEEVPE
jgi:hypothetical protein